ncbi:hypothetical protein [Conexibacter sp. DBS9H8]|uniref:hypothetical protein n=1 Tax=Conexibacter sp. DBS9H8 TaxID=2937801 RepID=UPI00200F5ADD|nr:hypothetical protein [Conexibacter sp. DBS9H8]
MGERAPCVAALLATPVFSEGVNRRFGELTIGEVRARAEELRAAAGWGPTARVMPVAAAWGELAALMLATHAITVADLPPAQIVAMTPGLWIAPQLGRELPPSR